MITWLGYQQDTDGLKACYLYRMCSCLQVSLYFFVNPNSIIYMQAYKQINDKAWAAGEQHLNNSMQVYKFNNVELKKVSMYWLVSASVVRTQELQDVHVPVDTIWDCSWWGRSCQGGLLNSASSSSPLLSPGIMMDVEGLIYSPRDSPEVRRQHVWPAVCQPEVRWREISDAQRVIYMVCTEASSTSNCINPPMWADCPACKVCPKERNVRVINRRNNLVYESSFWLPVQRRGLLAWSEFRTLSIYRSWRHEPNDNTIRMLI
jgi:hypothetical protein